MKKWRSFSEKTSLIAVMYYALVRFYDSSRFTFAFFDLPRIITVSVPVLLATAIRFFPCFIDDLRKSKNKKTILTRVVIGALFSLPCLYVAYRFDYNFLVYLACIPFCLYDIQIEKVLKAFTITIGIALVSTIICSLSGIIDNRINAEFSESHAGNLRGCYGIASTTDLAAYFVFLLLSFWCYRYGKQDNWNIIFTVFLVVAIIICIHIFTGTRTSVLLCTLFACLVLYEPLEKKILSQHSRIKWIPKTLEWLAVWSLPILAVVFYGITYLYGQGNALALRLDSLTNSRFKWTWTAILKYGIHAFGALTPQNGRGGDLISRWYGQYDFLDSTFGLLLIRYGWVLTAIVIFLWVWMIKRALKNGKRRMAFSMAIIALHCFTEHHFPEINYNIFLVTPLCGMLSSDLTNTQNKKEKNTWIPWLTAGVLLVTVYFFLPGILSRIRTVFDIQGWIGGKYSSFPALLLVTGCLVLLLVLWHSINKLIVSLTKGGKYKKGLLTGLIVPLLFFLGLFVWSEGIIDTNIYNDRLSADTRAMEIVFSSANQPVYVGQTEEVYKRRFKGISDRIDSAESICRERKGSVIVDNTEESYVLFHTGAVYAEISEYSSIYTYDEAVIHALKNAGYAVRGYYYTEREMKYDIGTAQNNWTIREDNSILLQAGNNFIDASSISLFAGDYTVKYDICVNPDSLSGDICDISITSYDGQFLINKTILHAEDFDENGHCIAEIPFTIKSDGASLGNAGISFNVYPKVELIINRISYLRSPSIDVWQSYDNNNRLVSERYFDMDGNPVAQNQGQYGTYYEYKNGSNWILRCYLDENGDKMSGQMGYAQVERIYNNKKQLVEERYFDEQGNICMTTSQYAIVKRGYDKAGNVILYQYFDTNGQLTQIKNGYAEIHREFNEKRQIITESYYGTDGEITTLEKGQATIHYEYDDSGNINRYCYYGTDGKPTMLTDGWAELQRKYNAQKQIIEESYYDTEGQLILRPSGYALVQREYDKYGNISVERYYGTDQKPILRRGGYSERRRKYNNKKQKICEEYYGINGEPIALSDNQHKVEYKYNENGTLIEERYYDLDGALLKTIQK